MSLPTQKAYAGPGDNYMEYYQTVDYIDGPWQGTPGDAGSQWRYRTSAGDVAYCLSQGRDMSNGFYDDSFSVADPVNSAILLYGYPNNLPDLIPGADPSLSPITAGKAAKPPQQTATRAYETAACPPFRRGLGLAPTSAGRAV